jgi:hypothetical protein
MVIVKSKGLTPTEQLLADLCEKSFLKLWSYPNPIKDDRDELCDLLAVFENQVFIFFDRENRQLDKLNKDPMVNWNRWKKRVIDDQIRTAYGAERYIKSGRGIFLDNDLKVPFPIDIDFNKIIIHKIIIAHGAKEAYERLSNNNGNGSLGICYGKSEIPLSFPFMINIDKEHPVHIFDTFNLPIIFGELDTFYDFLAYLNAKINAIKKFKCLLYCGEEDLLAHYFLNLDKSKNRYFIGTHREDIGYLMIGEGEWQNFKKLEIYKNKKLADKISYLWDEIIQKTCQNALDGTLLGDGNILKRSSAIHEMAKEPRLFRRALSDMLIQSIRNFPESSEPLVRNLSFMPSFYPEKGYVFLQLKNTQINDYENEHRPKRRKMLEIACGAAKNRFGHLKGVTGIAIDAPKYSKSSADDFILMNCSDWSEDDINYYEQANEAFEFFKSKNLTIHEKNVKQFPTTI